MREILFRGIKCDLRHNHFTKDKWAFGSLQDWGNNEYSILSKVKKNGNSDCYYIDPKTVGQFTGLTDKNGTKIFEGDIVKKGSKKFICVFTSGEFVLKNCYDKQYANLCETYNEINYCFWLEVIGNIHDNPELLEV